MWSYAAMDKMPEAIEAYSKSIEIDQSLARPFNNRATAYARLKQYDKAIADCDRAIELDTNDFLAWRNRGLAKHDKGDLDSAITDYDESIRINGKVAETYHYRGNVFLDQKKYSRALEDFEQAILLEDGMAAAHLSRAIALARLGREDDAIAAGQRLSNWAAKSMMLSSPTFCRLRKSLMTMTITWPPLRLSAVNWRKPGWRSLQELNRSICSRATKPIELVMSFAQCSRQTRMRPLASPPGNSSRLNLGCFNNADDRPGDHPEAKDGASATPSFSVLNTMEKWTPNVAQMQPVAWAMPVSKAGTPVASTESAP